MIAQAPAALVLLALAACSSAGGGQAGASAGADAQIATSVTLLPLRVSDPDHGPPWGMRVVATTRGLLCAQVGRVERGRLGQLGIDGAFHDDGRFHALAPDDLPEARAPGSAGDDADCVAPKETFAGEIDGLDRNAVANPLGHAIPLARRREISFGLLGTHALAVSYRVGASTRTQPVLRGLGAYLVVAPATADGHLGSSGAAPGGDYADDLEPAGPTGSLVSITYRFGRTVCRDTDHETVARCHLPGRPLGPERTPSQGGL